MKYLKKYRKYLESVVYSTYISNILESMNVIYDDLLFSISSEKKDMIEEFKLDYNFFVNKLDLEFLSNNIEFVNSLLSLGLKKSELNNSEDYSTFLIKPCRFMFIYDVAKNEIENPEYIIIQVWIETLNKWNDAELYKINGDIKRFYDKLSSKIIEIKEGDEHWIYQTNNGSEWVLQNLDKENDFYTKILRKEELMEILDERKPEVRIV